MYSAPKLIIFIIGFPFLLVFPIAKGEKDKQFEQFPAQTAVWWEKVDSNHRSMTQQIYSLPPLATREFSHIKLELVDGLEPPTC